jgi:hypothetical protein
MSLEATGRWVWIIRMHDSEGTSPEQIQAFSAGAGEVQLAAQLREGYCWQESRTREICISGSPGEGSLPVPSLHGWAALRRRYAEVLIA